jgi:putative two-component system response regulator
VIVDDDQDSVSLLLQMLSSLEGYSTICFTEPHKGLEWCARSDPDLVILDYAMPDMDGIEFLRRFRALEGKRDIPLLMVTVVHEKSVRYQALEMGATDFLTKPVDSIELVARVKNMLALRRSHKQLSDLAGWLAQEVSKVTDEIVSREREIIIRLSKAAEYRDPETGAHVLRMAHYSRLIAKNLGLALQDQDALLEAAPMHDIGKVGIPDYILLKPGPLSPAEIIIMRQHAQIGFEILKGSESRILNVAAQIALTHHEKYDGSGYPSGLKGDDIPIYGRIVALSDVFDALLSHRPYKEAWEVERVAETIRAGAGSHFDPACVDALFTDWQAVQAIMQNFRNESPMQ